MSTALLERPVERPATAPKARLHAARLPEPEPAITVYGDFNCPWSYLAFRRAAMLAVAGVHVDWRAVEHAPWAPGRRDDRPVRFEELHGEMDRVVDLLLPGEQLPYSLAGFVPRTRASVAAYAEACTAGVASVARKVIFESFWMHGIDIGDPKVLRILLTDELRSGSSASEAVRGWGYPVDITGGPISSDAWRLVRDWSLQWHGIRKQVVPVLQVDGEEPVFGVDAVEWLGEAITARGLELDLPPEPEKQAPSCSELPALGWVTENGGRWLRLCQHRPEVRALR